MIRKWIANKITEHSTSMSGVVPEQKWSEKDRAFFLNSPAGLIKFKPKTEAQRSRFRDKYINQFEAIRQSAIEPKIKEELFFRLYLDIRSKENVSYTANVHTRLKGALCSLRV